MNNSEEKDSMKLFMIRQPTSITMSKHTLNVPQMRIMFRICEALQPRMIRNKAHYEIDSTSLGDTVIKIPVKLLTLDSSHNHKQLRTALKDMTKKDITLPVVDAKGLKSEVYTNILKSVEFGFRENFVDLEIDRRILPQFLALAQGYTRYNVEIAFKSSSVNTMKIYQYISRFRDLKQIECNVDSLREFLELKNKYKENRDIKKWILEPAIKELKDRGDVYFEIAERVMDKKNKRRLKAWKFNIHHNVPKESATPQILDASQKKADPPHTKPPTSKDIEAQIQALQAQKKRIKEQEQKAAWIKKLIQEYGLGEKQAKKLSQIAEKNPQAITKVLIYKVKRAIQSGAAKNPGAYTIATLKKELDIDLASD